MSLQKEITLKDLCGFHLLQGFELTKQKADGYCIVDECNVVKFMLDGVTYIAVENPDDGYRSYCDGIKISEEKPMYSIPDCEVICKMKPDGCFDEHDVLIGVDAHTGLVVFEVGTLCVNDYYPYCHFEYHPENMYCNRNANEASE